LIWTAPAFLMLVAYGLMQLANVSEIFKWCVGFAVVLSTLPALYSQSTHAIKPQYKNVVDYVMQQSSADDLLLFQIPYNARVFEYYARNLIYHQDAAPYTNWRLPDGSYQVDENYVMQEMGRISDGYQRIWLIYSEVELWDQRGMVKTWLDSHWILYDQQHYQGVSLYGYRR
jgi:hypothetical protein